MSAPQDPRDPQGQPGYRYQPGPSQQGDYYQQGYEQGDLPAGYPAGSTGPYPGQQQVKRPGVLVVSVVLWVLTGLFLLFIGFGSVSAVGSPAAEQQISEAVDMLAGYGMQVDPATVQRALVVTGIVALALGALLVILSLLMLAQQNWARVLLTIVGVIAMVPLLGTIVGPLVVLVAIVMHFLPPVNAWFHARRQAA